MENFLAAFHSARCLPEQKEQTMHTNIRTTMPTLPVLRNLTCMLAFTAALIVVPSAFAQGPAIANFFSKSDIEIARDVAPYVYFHEDEHNWPIDYETFLSNSTLRRKSDGAYIANALDPSYLLRLTNDGATSKDYYLDVWDGLYGGNADLSRTKVYVRVHNRPGFSVTIPILNEKLTLLTMPRYKEIQFWFFFPFNGCQTQRTHALGSNLKYYTSYFQMCDAARHEGDVEAVTVFIDQSNGKPLGIATTRHGTVVYTKWEDLYRANGTHPYVFSAWASHAMYTTPGRKALSDNMAGLAATLCGIINLESWGLYDLPTADGKRWDPIAYSYNLVETTTSTPITKFHGNWGLMGMYNRHVKLPAAPGSDENLGQDVVKTIADSKIKSCFDTIISVTSGVYDLTSIIGSNPIYAFDPVGLNRDKLTGNGTDWFSKDVWLNGMKIEKLGK
jgi:hypothetical protein